MKIFFSEVLIFAFCAFNFIGCAAITEGAKGIAGLSTRCLEDARKDAAVQVFQCDHKTCYDKSLEILKQMHTYVYAQDKKKDLIAIYASAEDTTPVGLFFKKIDANNTQIEVSSPSTLTKENIATKLFPGLVIALNPAAKEEKVKKEE